MPTVLTPGGVKGQAAFAHVGTARRLVHRLKYHADLGAGARLVAPMLSLLEGTVAWALIPVPRARLRHLRYGIDPARWLAVELSKRSGLPVVPGLGAGLWWRSHAASSHRRAPSFVARGPVPAGAVLIDDVVTSGATLDAAAAATGVSRALTATAAPRPKGPIGAEGRRVGWPHRLDTAHMRLG